MVGADGGRGDGGIFALFAWDHEREYGGGETSGPYSIWQGLLMAAVVIALTAGATRRRMPLRATMIIPAVLAYWFAWDWSKTDDSGLYALGVLMLAIGSFLGVGFVALLARNLFSPETTIGNEPAPDPR